jgi:hypothetical protein
MATAGVPLWSTTANSNNTADPAVNWSEGQAPSTVNDSARALMASVANWRNDLYGITTGGTSTAFTVATGSTFATAAAMSGVIFTIVPHTSSGAAPTLAVDGLTARAINSSTGVAVPTGALLSGSPYLVKYVHASTEFILLGQPGFSATQRIRGRYSSGAGPEEELSIGTGLLLSGAGVLSAASSAGGGNFINGTITESNGSNAVTFAVKTLAGTDPSATDPVYVIFRNVTVGTGNYVVRSITAALSVVISSGSTMGFTSGVAARLWVIAVDNAGTVELAAINCRSGTNIYPLGQFPIISTTAEGGAGAADSAHVAYSTTARTSKAYVPLAYASYESGLVTAGTWTASPTRIQLFGPGVPLPGQTVQVQANQTGAVATGATVMPLDDTIPENDEGDQYMTQAITPTSSSNVLTIRHEGVYSENTAAEYISTALFQDSTVDALAATSYVSNGVSYTNPVTISHRMLAATTSATTFKIRTGPATTGTVTFNGFSGNRKFGGVMASNLCVEEIMT